MTLLLRKTILLSGLCIACFSLSAQTNTLFGKVGTQPIDQNFVNVMQILNPEFGYIPDSAAFMQRLFKDYIIVKANADEARSKKLNENPEVKKNLELIKQLVEDRYLNFLNGKKSGDVIYEITDAEALDYYNKHAVLFTNAGTYTYFEARVSNTVTHPLAEVKKQMSQYATFVTDEFKSGNGDDFSVVFVKNRKLTSQHSEYSALEKLKENEFSETLTEGAQQVIYLLLNKKAPTLQPFQTVKEVCIANVINEKRASENEAFINNALEKYPVKLNPEYFKH